MGTKNIETKEKKEEKRRRFLKLFKKEEKQTELQNEERDKIRVHDYLAKMVNQDNTIIGESIAVEETRLIVKNSDCFISIPLEAVKKNKEDILVGDFNREESLVLGKEWSLRKDTMKFDDNGMLIREV